MRFWLGGYTSESGGSATGIGTLLAGDADAGSAGGALSFGGNAARGSGSPSWLSAHPTLDVVYAALEGAGTVQAFRRTGEASFAALGDAIEAGDSVCHVAIAPNGAFLIASCWADGRVVRMNVDAEGRPSTPTLRAAAVDPYRAGGAGFGFAGSGSGSASGFGSASEPASEPGSGFGSAPGFGPGDDIGAGAALAAAARALRDAAGGEFAHLVPGYDAEAEAPPTGGELLNRGAAAAAGGAGSGAAEGATDAASRVSRAHQAAFVGGDLIATTDMGLDLVRFWQSVGGELRQVQQVVLPAGSGPRHMVWHPSGHLYVVAELSCEIYALAPDITGAWRMVAGAPLGNTLAGDTAAELATSRDGEFLYAGVRGSNTLATVRVRGAGDILESVALVDAGVVWPRHHLVVRDSLLVAGERSNEVASLTLDLRTGVPGRVRYRAEAPSPTCLLPAR